MIRNRFARERSGSTRHPRRRGTATLLTTLAVLTTALTAIEAPPANPCPPGRDRQPGRAGQGGLARTTTTSPDPDGAAPQTPRTTEVVHDGAGRVVASRVGAEAWTCATDDARGRILTRSIPANPSAPARTISYTYSVGPNPLAWPTL